MEAPGPETVSRAPARSWVRLALVFYAAMLALALLWREAWLGQSLAYASPADAQEGVRWGTDLGLGIAAGLAAVAVSRWTTRRTHAGRRLARALAAALGPLSLRQCLVLALASGLGEEALFRGAVQPSLGLFGASLLFGAVHFSPRRDLWSWSLLAVVAGFGLGILFETTGNLVAPVAAHATLNAINLRFLVKEYGEDSRASARCRLSSLPR